MANFKVSLTDTTPSFTLKTNAAAASRLDTLGDVDTTVSQANGSIMVYNAKTDTYVQRDVITFDSAVNAFKMDGGSF